MTKRQTIALVLTVIAILVDCYGVFFASSVPSITVPVNIHHNVLYWKGTEPPVGVDLEILLTASGALSVNNPVRVHVNLLNANVSDLIHYYNRLSFTDAYQSGVNPNPNQAPITAGIPIVAGTHVGEYVADGTIVWLLEGPTWVYLAPNVATDLRIIAQDVQSGDPIVQIGSVSDTLSIQNSIAEYRLSWIVVGFSVLMLQPILDQFASRSRQSSPQQLQQEKPQGLWHQHKLWRKKRSQQTPTT